jgi:hypothetical protein
MNEPPLLGSFETAPGIRFEYSTRPLDDRGGVWSDYPLRVFTLDGDRAARILKTVAYVVTDESPDGGPVVERWNIRKLRQYSGGGK